MWRPRPPWTGELSPRRRAQQKRGIERYSSERARVKRLKAILRMRRDKKTYREIGEAFGITHQRAQQLFEKAQRIVEEG